ncbi:hypothetical protein QOZ95_004016 [Paenibacillus brasilensis]|uniref:Rhamnogalacturonan lyase n=1 Tax=Paenibacillus brasilensis TaxID=128574 RepID=A0ABU0L3H2_9BACL|nr:hypothetical protein [Paenibacillus brasilensis]
MNKRFRYTALLCLGVMLCGMVTPMDSQVSAASTRQMEKLSRGAVAVKVPEGVLVSWRLLGTEADSVSFNLYRGTSKVNDTPITSRTNYLDKAGTTSSSYTVRAVVNGTEQAASPVVKVWSSNNLDVPIQQPAGGKTPDNVSYAYQANDASIGDLDGDDKDEIVYGSLVVDDNGAKLANTGMGHGDALHVGDLDPDRSGYEVFKVNEDKNATYGAAMYDPRNGNILWGVNTGKDTGRGMSADIDPRTKGNEQWAPGIGLRSAKGALVTNALPSSINFGIWWDGDLLVNCWIIPRQAKVKSTSGTIPTRPLPICLPRQEPAPITERKVHLPCRLICSVTGARK